MMKAPRVATEGLTGKRGLGEISVNTQKSLSGLHILSRYADIT